MLIWLLVAWFSGNPTVDDPYYTLGACEAARTARLAISQPGAMAECLPVHVNLP